MIFKKKMICCFKCDQKYPDSYECCPVCYPTDFEMTPANIAVMVIIFIVLAFAIYYMG